MSEAGERFVKSDRDQAEDSEARQWARRMRDALETGAAADDLDALKARLAEEKSKQQSQ